MKHSVKNRTVDTRVEDLIVKHGLLKCVQCGKCTSACTMTEIFEDFRYSWAPRTIVHEALFGTDLFRASSIWYCLVCDVCEVTCPSGVHFRDFIGSLRDLAVERGYIRNLRQCKRCGRPILPRHTSTYIQTKAEDYTPDSVLLCERCKKYILAQKFKENLRASRKVEAKCQTGGKKKSRR